MTIPYEVQVLAAQYIKKISNTNLIDVESIVHHLARYTDKSIFSLDEETKTKQIEHVRQQLTMLFRALALYLPMDHNKYREKYLTILLNYLSLRGTPGAWSFPADLFNYPEACDFDMETGTYTRTMIHQLLGDFPV